MSYIHAYIHFVFEENPRKSVLSLICHMPPGFVYEHGGVGVVDVWSLEGWEANPYSRKVSAVQYVVVGGAGARMQHVGGQDSKRQFKVYIYIHTHTHTYMQIYTYIHTYIHMHTYTYTYTHIHAKLPIRM